MGSINLQDIILDNRDMEFGSLNTYNLNSDLIIGENSTVFLEQLINFLFLILVLQDKVVILFHLK